VVHRLTIIAGVSPPIGSIADGSGSVGGTMQRITVRRFSSRVRTRSYNAIASRAAIALLLGLGCYTPASAHCIVGNRFFPATLNVDDPCVADELSMPTIAGFKNGDDPSARELDISGEYSKTGEFRRVVRGGMDPSRHSP
jgi:hypothetical protein